MYMYIYIYIYIYIHTYIAAALRSNPERPQSKLARHRAPGHEGAARPSSALRSLARARSRHAVLRHVGRRPARRLPPPRRREATPDERAGSRCRARGGQRAAHARRGGTRLPGSLRRPKLFQISLNGTHRATEAARLRRARRGSPCKYGTSSSRSAAGASYESQGPSRAVMHACARKTRGRPSCFGEVY